MSFQIIFMGTPEFAIDTLDSIIKEGHKVIRVYTQPPNKKQRGQKVLKSPVHLAAERLKLDIKTPNNLSDNEDFLFFKNSKIDIVVVAAYGKIIPEKFLRLPKITYLNLHASLLPKWRGAAPIERSILNLDCETGVSIMKIITKLDEGPFMIQKKVTIEKDTTKGELEKKLSLIGADAIIEALKIIAHGNVKFTEQDHSKSSYAKKIEKFELKINWKDKAKNIIAKINAFNPKPGAWFFFKEQRIKILRAKEINLKGKPGEILDDDMTIGAGQNSVKILELQKEGKSVLSSKEFLRGNKFQKGTQLP